MPKVPLCSSKELEKILLKKGFLKTRQKGSHAFYRYQQLSTTIPHHASRQIARPLLLAILKQADISIDEYLGLR